MTTFKFISNNLDAIKEGIHRGLINPSVLNHWQMYSRYDYYKRIGNKTTDAVVLAAMDCNINDRSWAFRIKKNMEYEY